MRGLYPQGVGCAVPGAKATTATLRTEGGSCDRHRAEGLTQSSVLCPQSSGRGFTLIEMLIVISLVGILASMLFSRILFYQEMAEKAAVQQVVSALKTALVLEYGHRMTLNLGSDINNIKTENPMEWLSQKPNNYAGEFDLIKPGVIEPGSWSFERNSHELVYVPNHDEYLSPPQDGFKRIRFHTRFTYDSHRGAQGKGAKVFTGVIFTPVEPYQWLIREK